MAKAKDVESGESIILPLISRGTKEVGCGSNCMVLLSTLVAVAGSFQFGMSGGFSSPAQAGIRRDLHLTLAEYSMFGSILTIGAMVGAIMSGRLSDFLGRKGAMRISSIFCVVGWLFIYVAKGAWSLDIGRLSLGYGIGILSFVVPTYIAEITPKNMRGALTTANQLLIVCGGSFSYLLGTVVTWRTLALMGFIPSMLQMLGLCFIPESPRWLAKVGKQEEFESELRRLRGGSADISDEAIEIQKYVESIAKLPKARIRDLFRRNYLYSVIVAVGLILLQQFGGINGIGFYASETFVAAGFSSGNAGTVAMAAIQVPVTTVGALLLDRVGRRPLIMVSATGTCLGCFLAGLSFLIKGHVSSPDIIPILALAGILLYIGSFSIGLGAVPWLIMSEIFPLHVKGMAGSLVTLVHWFGSWAISYAFNFLMTWSSSGTLFVFSAVGALTVLFVAKLVPETKGRTLEEITSAMSSFSSTKL
ncbi:sugar transporter ERD6-like 16 [Nymphaea colorata]|uniref:sugar transporter ERD6-like 16 n=1 Tax=Nymphaea colorata TaxID=210225 RepID=UPI00129DD626|nr:sugar transporter ERD6-like 16 [Nymphaea colorata]